MLEVMQAGDRRIVVLTQTHVALLRVRVAAVRSVYRAMWKVRLSKIQTVRGAPLHPPRAPRCIAALIALSPQCMHEMSLSEQQHLKLRHLATNAP